MRPRPCIRTALRWISSALTGLLVACWIGSAWWCLEWHNGTLEEVVVQCGCLRATIEMGPTSSTSTMNGWYFWKLPPDAPMQWMPRYQHSRFLSAIPGAPLCHIFYLTLPLWIPAALSAVPTAAAWHLHRLARRREHAARTHRCPRCGYDLAGIAPATPCPECGGASIALPAPGISLAPASAGTPDRS